VGEQEKGDKAEKEEAEEGWKCRSWESNIQKMRIEFEINLNQSAFPVMEWSRPFEADRLLMTNSYVAVDMISTDLRPAVSFFGLSLFRQTWKNRMAHPRVQISLHSTFQAASCFPALPRID